MAKERRPISDKEYDEYYDDSVGFHLWVLHQNTSSITSDRYPISKAAMILGKLNDNKKEAIKLFCEDYGIEFKEEQLF